MTQTAHFGESSAQQPSVLMDVAVPNSGYYAGTLGNQRTQAPAVMVESKEEELWLRAMPNKHFGAVRPDSKLATLKRQKFTPEGRENRVAVSLDALDAPQPTVLTREQWKELVEEVEDED
jgi:hypothetical protein